MDNPSDTNPFVHCHNPLLFGIRIYFLLKNINKKVYLSAKDVETFAGEVILFVGEFIDEISHKALLNYITEKDIINRNFFDYFFESNAIELKNQVYVY